MEYLTTAEVAALVRAPVESVRFWRHVGRGPKSFKVGRRVLYAREDVQAFIEQARQAGVCASPRTTAPPVPRSGAVTDAERVRLTSHIWAAQ